MLLTFAFDTGGVGGTNGGGFSFIPDILPSDISLRNIDNSSSPSEDFIRSSIESAVVTFTLVEFLGLDSIKILAEGSGDSAGAPSGAPPGPGAAGPVQDMRRASG